MWNSKSCDCVSAMDVPRSDILQYILLMYRLEKYKVKKAFVRARVKMVREIYKRVGLWVEDLPGCLSHFDSAAILAACPARTLIG
jgi:hypothetical protein